MTVRPPNLSPLASAVISALGRTNRRALSVPFTDSIYPEAKVPGAAYASTDIYTYNAQRVNLDYLGNAFLLPKHYNAPEGVSYFQNEFAAQGVDWTDVSNWTEGTGVTVSQENETTLRAVGVGSSSSGNALRIDIMSGTDVAGRVAGAVAYIWTDDPDEVGNTVVFRIKRVSGGTDTPTDVSVTLSLTPKPIYTGEFTGLASNTGLSLAFANSGTSDNFLIQYPGIIEWRTGQDTSKPPMPEHIKCFVPVGPEISLGAFVDVSTGDSSISSSGGQFTVDSGAASVAQGYWPISGVAGQTYCIEDTHVSGDPVGWRIGTTTLGSDIEIFSNIQDAATTYETFVASGSTQYLNLRKSTAGTGVIETPVVRESANGFYCSDRVPANTVSSGVITRGTGTLLHPWHWERIGYSVPLKVKDQYDPWEASTAYGSGVRVIPTTKNGWYFISSGGTSDGSEPDWSTVTAPGDTVTDNDITWTAGYYTNLGVPIEPATTQDMATAAVLATGGSASTYPTSWTEADSASQLSVVGYGVSSINPDASYVDVRVNNTTGSNKSSYVTLYSTSTTGITQGDDITVSAWLEIISGSQGGDVVLGINERDSGDAGLVDTYGSDLAPSGGLRRYDDTLTVANASTDRYRPYLRFQDVPDGTDFTIRITLPNSVQQDFLSSVILGQETRTSQAQSLVYDIANASDSNWQWRLDVSLGVAQSDIAANQSAFAAFFNNIGNLAQQDGTNTNSIPDWSEPANNVMRIAGTNSTDENDMSLYQRSPDGTTRSDSDPYDGARLGATLNVATTVNYPMHFHGLWSIPNGYESSVTLTSDSARYE